MYKVEKKIPIPQDGRHGTKYPFPDMQIGDSIEFDREEYHRVYSAARIYGYRHGKKFSVRAKDGKARIWRVE